MKISKFISFVILPFCISCNLVSFDRPMPEDGKLLSEFPASLIGTYYSAQPMFDSTTYNEKFYPNIHKQKDSVEVNFFELYINEKDISYTEIEKKYYDTTKINHNTISIETFKKDVIRENTGKYVLFKTVKKEKITDLGKDILIEKNGQYFLNIKNNEQDWNCIPIKKEKKNAISIHLFSPENLKHLPDDYTVKKTDNGTIFYNVSSAQFDYLLQENYFEKLFSLKKKK